MKQLKADLPTAVAVGYIVNHRYGFVGLDKRQYGETFYSAIPLVEEKTQHQEDFALGGFRDPIPKRFIVGDGSTQRVLIGIDFTFGSPLHRAIRRIHNSIDLSLGKKITKELVQELLAQNVAHHVGYVKAPLPWDKAIGARPATQIDFTKIPVSDPPIAAGFTMPVVPLEDYIDEGEAYCLGQSLTVWLVLRSFGIPARLHFGANAADPDLPTGHTTVELEDGRFVDAASGLVIEPPSYKDGPKLPGHLDKGWQFMPGYLTYPGALPTWRVQFERYPVLVLED